MAREYSEEHLAAMEPILAQYEASPPASLDDIHAMQADLNAVTGDASGGRHPRAQSLYTEYKKANTRRVKAFDGGTYRVPHAKADRVEAAVALAVAANEAAMQAADAALRARGGPGEAAARADAAAARDQSRDAVKAAEKALTDP